MLYCFCPFSSSVHNLEVSLHKNIYFSSLPVLLVKIIIQGLRNTKGWVETLGRLEINFRFDLNKFFFPFVSNYQWHFICEDYVQMVFMCNDILDICMYVHAREFLDAENAKCDKNGQFLIRWQG